MPARKKKSTVKKPKKGKSGISINIKNVMKQVMNERPRQRQRTDFIMPQGKDPRHNLNTGSMTRLFAPAVTYASAPLSAFPSLASLQPIQGGRVQPQLDSRSQQPLGAPPLVAPRDIKNDDLMVPVLKTTRVSPSEPIVPAYSATSEYGNPVVTALPSPVEQYMTPRGLPSRLLDSFNGKDDPQEDASQMAVAAASDQDSRNYLEGLLPPPLYDSEDESMPLSEVKRGIREQRNREHLTELIAHRDTLIANGYKGGQAFQLVQRRIDSFRKRAGNTPPPYSSVKKERGF